TTRAVVPQGSLLSALFYALFTSDIPRDLPATVKLSQFTDDTARSHDDDPKKSNIASRRQKALHLRGKWFRLWRIEVNPEKSAAVLFTGKPRGCFTVNPAEVTFNGRSYLGKTRPNTWEQWLALHICK
ncbi:jg26598, partial [Pararge aegeria aegeria]